MISRPLSVLLAHHNEAVLTALRDAIRREDSVRVVATQNGLEAVVLASRDHPDVIFCAAHFPDLDATDLCQQIKASPGLEHVGLIMVSGSPATSAQLIDSELEADGILREPVADGEVLAALRGIAKTLQLKIRLGRGKDEQKRLEHAMNNTFDPFVDLLVHLTDLSLPGAAARGSVIAGLAQRLADRFEIPEHLHRDLIVAARLHEIGRLPALVREGVQPDVHLNDGPLLYTATSHYIMTRLQALQEPADLVKSIPENWDGTGRPDRRRKGQIPLRSRILRVLIDFVHSGGTEGPAAPEEVVLALTSHCGTWYDPLVVNHLDGIIASVSEQGLSPSRRLVPVPQLEEGMVLAEDLLTSSGIKLVRRDTELTTDMLHTIQRRHHLDPVLEGVRVRT